jgi:type I restriction enzyme S subunit
MVSEWSEKSLVDLCSIIKRGIGPKYIEEGGVLVINQRCIRDQRVSLSEARRNDPEKKKIPEDRFVQPGDVLINSTGVGTLGRVAQVKDVENPTTVDSHVTIARLDDETVDSTFFGWSFKYLQPVIEELGEGSTGQTELSRHRIGELNISIPPLPEQKAIAHVLGSLDDKIELNKRMNETLEGMAQALFKSWFVDFDPVIDNALAAGNPIPEPLAQRAETRRQAIANGTANREAAQAFPASFRFTEELGYIPEGWEESDVGNVSSCYDKNRIPLSKKQREEKKPGLIPYYGATSVMDYINEWIFDDTFLLVGEDGSVMKDDGTPFTQYIWGKTWVNNHAHVLQGKGSISTEHLMLFMQSQNVTAFVTGAVQMKINQGNLNSIPFLKAEDSTNEVFGETISPIYQNIKNRIVESQTLAKLRDVLLPKLISGELRIPQAEKMVGDAIA